ncbi:MAG: hypothetical protein KC766_38020, partial [Myxococcales bacterium]|nr:hypothetical protein [Myxococcales bacterium]
DHGCEYMTGGLVVVLGPTGRNFGAGMSGGLAYVYDEDGHFSDRCNRELVSLEALSMEDSSMLAELLERHQLQTRSTKARNLLATWETTLSRFIKVFPLEYKRVLAEQEEKRAAEAQNNSIPPEYEPQPEAIVGGPRSAEVD